MRVIFLGGGTLGHVIPNLAVIEELCKRSKKHEILYIGKTGGVEKDAVYKFAKKNDCKNIAVKEIVCGKMRRYFSFENFVDFFRVPVGFFQCLGIIIRFKPQVIFSKGGYVSVPGVLACGLINFLRGLCGKERITLFVHESDVEPGLANKIGAKFSSKVLLSFEKSKKYFSEKDFSAKRDIIVVGNPVRPGIFHGNEGKGMRMCGFNRFKPIILVMGGSLGALQINELVWDSLERLLKKYQVVHITGKGNLNFGLKKAGYKQFELLYDELKDVYAASNLIVTRGGANSLAEVSSLEKRAVVIPLGLKSSRGDQITNARVCAEKYGWSILHGDVTPEQFLRAIEIALREDFKSGENLHKKAAVKIVDLIYDVLGSASLT